MDRRTFLSSVLTAFLTVLFGVLVLYLFPWDKIKIGNNPLFPKSTITVSGEAQGNEKNQIATFTASVMSTNDDKQKAVDETNTKMTDLIKSVKALGIVDDDIKTENISIYEQPSPYPVPMMYPTRTGTGQGAWAANNTTTVTVRDLTKVSPLADLLQKGGATNVYGPNYTVDNTTNTQADVLGQAIENARKKAEKIAQASGRSLGKAVTIQEGGQYGGIYPLQMDKAVGLGGGSAPSTPVQPGTQTVYKSVTVTFELK
ncbi:MAG TPA: SIMPL domain-containing protein [Patescibacteria group bacterium]